MSLLFDREGKRKYLSNAERQAFLSAALKMPAEVRTFCLVLAYTGARISEVLRLTAQQVDLEAKVVIFETLKKRRRGVFRAVPLPPDVLSEIDRIHDVRRMLKTAERARNRIWPWCRTTAWHHVKAAMEAAVVTGVRATPKGLRHAFAVSALQSGVPINLVRKWLGHSRLSTTEIYADAVGAEEQAFAGRLWSTLRRRSH